MSPGIYYIPVGPPTLSRLVALAGGLQTYAKSDVLLVHKQGPKENIDLNSILEKGHTEKDMALIPGDWVHVPGSPY
jgi:protein involved in polysaccharide export with SLBB domain